VKKKVKVKVVYDDVNTPDFEFEIDENDTFQRENESGPFSIDISQIRGLLSNVMLIKHWLEAFGGDKIEIETSS